MEREQLLKVMVPVGALALLLILVGAVITLNTGKGTPTNPAVQPPDGHTPPPDMPGAPPAANKYTFPLDAPEWKELADGLKIWDVKEGTGDACPSLTERPNLVPVMHYTGWLTNGTQFDSSRTKGVPLTLPLGQLIEGWKRGVPGMKPGGVRRLIIPSAMGYGTRGQGSIPGGATLVFEMELLEVR